MSFDNFVNNLSNTLATGKMTGGFYDLHLHQMRGMSDSQRRNHIHSMKQSQKHDYQCDLRLVLTEQDDIKPGINPFLLDAYCTPGIETAAQAATQIVIRRDGTEKVVKG